MTINLSQRETAPRLIARLSRLCPPWRVPLARFGPALGIHGGPGTVAVIAKVKED